MDETALRALGAEPLGWRQELLQHQEFALLHQVQEGLQRQHVVEVHQQLVVEVHQQHEARQSSFLAPRAELGHPLGTLRFHQRLDLFLPHPPARPGEDQAPGDHPRQEAGALQQAPAPAHPRSPALVLEGGEEAVEPQVAAREVVGRGQARDHPLVEALGT